MYYYSSLLPKLIKRSVMSVVLRFHDITLNSEVFIGCNFTA